MTPYSKTSKLPCIFFGLTLVWLIARVIYTAWVSDDAYITFRVVDNIINGFGATWNTDERVQVYTHPLWMLLHVPFYWLFGNIYLVTIALSLVCFFAAIALVIRHSKHSLTNITVFFLLPMSLSVPVMEYSSSGLENPLGMLLIAWFCHTLTKSDLKTIDVSRAAFISALLIMTRMDYAIVIAPVWLYLLYRKASVSNYIRMITSAWPLWLWCGFSLIYYGFIFPNTKYAKLSNGIPSAELLTQGLYYVYDLLVRDSLSFTWLFFIPLATLISIFTSQTNNNKLTHIIPKLLVAGSFIYILYVIKIGGDFMSGRFWAIPLFTLLLASLHLIPVHYPVKYHKLLLLVTILVLGSALSHWHYTMQWETGCKALGFSVEPSDHDKEICAMQGIVNERLYYRRMTGLIDTKTLSFRTHIEGHLFDKAVDLKALAKHSAQPVKMAGINGYYVEPEAKLVDIFALTDPLLARLPAKQEEWRIGHFERAIPAGYLESRSNKNNQIADPALAEYYTHLRLITSGKIFDFNRLETILKFQFGAYNHLLEEYKKNLGGST